MLVQSNDVIQELTAATSYPTLGSSILPVRTLVRFGVNPVACKNVVTESSNFASRSKITCRWEPASGKRSPKLLHNPIRRWVPRNVEVQDLTTGALDHKEAVQQLKLD